MSIIALVIFFIIILLWTHRPKSSKRRTLKGNDIHSSISHNGTHYPSNVQDFLCEESPAFCQDNAQKGLNELEQTTQSRGYIPHANQPNHVANMWKCDQSQKAARIYDGTGREVGTIESDDHVIVRGKTVNLCVGDASEMHLTSRFSSTSS